jgi:hypothetical protein
MGNSKEENLRTLDALRHRSLSFTAGSSAVVVECHAMDQEKVWPNSFGEHAKL